MLGITPQTLQGCDIPKSSQHPPHALTTLPRTPDVAKGHLEEFLLPSAQFCENCWSEAASPEQGRGWRTIASRDDAAGSEHLPHPTPALPAASPDSAQLQQHFTALQDALPKTQPANSRNCLERSLPLAIHRDGATGRGDLAGDRCLFFFFY